MSSPSLQLGKAVVAGLCSGRGWRSPTGGRPGSRRRRPSLEALEGRRLLAGVIAEYPVPGTFATLSEITVEKAVYDPRSLTVELAPRGRLDPHRVYRLTVNGSGPGGVRDVRGELLDGKGTDSPGSDSTTDIKASNLVLGGDVPGGPARPAKLRAILAKIEAGQSRLPARRLHPAMPRAAARRGPIPASSAPAGPVAVGARRRTPKVGFAPR